MNRKEFIFRFWKTLIKPVLLLALVYFIIKFLIKIFSENGPERMISVIVLCYVLLLLIAGLLGSVFKSLIEKINSILSDRSKYWFRVFKKIIDYVAPILLGALIYKFWKEDWVTAAIICGIFLIEKIRIIVMEEKLSVA